MIASIRRITFEKPTPPCVVAGGVDDEVVIDFNVPAYKEVSVDSVIGVATTTVFG